MTLRPLWTCPRCDAQFVTANILHSCGRFSLETLFARTDASTRAVFERLRVLVHDCGPVKMIPQKTRVVFMVRMRFLSVQPRKAYLRLGIVLSRRIDDPRFHHIEPYSPRCFGHVLHVSDVKELDAKVKGWLRQAYAVGEQKALARKSAKKD
jgi:hypothetical protein